MSTAEVRTIEKDLDAHEGSKRYENNLRGLAQKARSSGLPAVNDIAWFAYTGTMDAPRKRVRMAKKIAGEPTEVAVTRKEYFTVPVGSGESDAVLASIEKFQNSLPALAEELARFSVERGDRVSFKIPGNLQYFIKHPDSLVVHYGNPENSQDIREIVTRHLTAIGMSPVRDGRAETGFDFKSENDLFDGSHSSFMSSAIADSMVRAVKEKPEMAKADPARILAFLDRKCAEVAAYTPEQMLARLEAIHTAESNTNA
jgi:hypothetical protein